MKHIPDLSNVQRLLLAAPAETREELAELVELASMGADYIADHTPPAHTENRRSWFEYSQRLAALALTLRGSL